LWNSEARKEEEEFGFAIRWFRNIKCDHGNVRNAGGLPIAAGSQKRK
jgi:hypothetical protein